MSDDEQQFEVIPADRVRSFETEALNVCDDYYENSNRGDDDSDIEVIPKESVLYSSALQKSKTSVNSIVDAINDAVGTYDDDDLIHRKADYDTEEEIEDAEDVLAMEPDMLEPSDDDNIINRLVLVSNPFFLLFCEIIYHGIPHIVYGRCYHFYYFEI